MDTMDTHKQRRSFWSVLGCFVGIHRWDTTWLALRCSRCGKLRNKRDCIQRGNIVLGDMAGGDIIKGSENQTLAAKCGNHLGEGQHEEG